MGREKWLNGWPRIENQVVIGVMTHCAGCGFVTGSVAAYVPVYDPAEDIYPNMPDWPFEVETCPIHNTHPWVLTIEDIAAMPFHVLRQAITIKKSHHLAAVQPDGAAADETGAETR